MTENEIYRKLQPILSRFGTTSRIENTIVSGLPDVLFFTHDLLLMLELKVVHSGKIRIQPFQFSFLTKVAHDYPEDKIWFVMYEAKELGLYPWAQIRPLAMKAPDLGSIDVSSVLPQYGCSNDELREWIGDLDGRLR